MKAIHNLHTKLTVIPNQRAGTTGQQVTLCVDIQIGTCILVRPSKVFCQIYKTQQQCNNSAAQNVIFYHSWRHNML